MYKKIKPGIKKKNGSRRKKEVSKKFKQSNNKKNEQQKNYHLIKNEMRSVLGIFKRSNIK
ncbi:hypothetical protein OSSY52_19530 [Tepiditoga spiralis]|uniref:Uncharacterized protein n=1 Tax=Tepiditoga spiralis TaxID=2108365 RepID=A0A7G1GBL6_9BACT|nr:hypothetical protein [Tepiditoga spiralis]BBE31812.1 hypothetical protein OSSY52_19530 [Tepiditoga spiralis]